MLIARCMDGTGHGRMQGASNTKKSAAYMLFIVISLAMTSPFAASEASTESEVFTISGLVMDQDGGPADTTSIKVDSMSSIWSENGAYTVSGISYGQHTIRAYFMNNGHNVIYRQIFVDSDVTLDWHAEKNWVTFEVRDSLNQTTSTSDEVEIELLETSEVNQLQHGHSDFGPLEVGEYYTLKTSFGEDGQSDHYKRLRIETGSASAPAPNHLIIHEGKNSLFGTIVDASGVAMQGVTVRSGDSSCTTNTDGFYMLEHLEIGTTHNVTFHQGAASIHPPVSMTMTSQEAWLNLTAELEIMLPGNLSFTTRIQAIPLGPVDVEWTSGPFTDYFHVYVNELLIFNTTRNSVQYTPAESGSYEFRVEAVNTNGSTSIANSLRIMVLPEQSNSDLWGVGMNWNYSVDYYPSSINEQISMTVIGKEPMTDAFDRERESFLVRMDGPHYEDEERSYRWVDSENLLYLHSYWADDPDVSSYYQEGSLGWNFTDANGDQADLLSSEDNLSMHFNRTNIIGVPGHPNGYDDTQNRVEITKNVEIETLAGTFSTTYICITDMNDGVKSWELWYNDTVRNWVKKVDRLPGSHSDYLVMELTSYEVPTTPQFITQTSTITNKNYNIEWADFQGTESYELYQNGVLIYSGPASSYQIQNQKDGDYTYELLSILSSGFAIGGDELSLSLEHIVISPELETQTTNTSQGKEVTFAWSEVEDAIWYTLTMEQEDGEMTVVYNGTATSYTGVLDDEGRNRFRISAGTSDGKYSEPSDSVFIFVEVDQEVSILNDQNFRNLIFGIVVLAVILSLVSFLDRSNSS